MNWQEAIEFLGGAAVLAAVFAYLGKTAIDAFVAGRIESYKGELQRVTLEHSVRFQRLHAERADIVKELYALLVTLDTALSSALRSFQHCTEPTLEEKVDEVAKAHDALRDYFAPRRVFFDESTCHLIEKIIEQFRDSYWEITVHPVDPLDPTYREHRDLLSERHTFWEGARAVHKTEITSAKKMLEATFRQLLGIEA